MNGFRVILFLSIVHGVSSSDGEYLNDYFLSYLKSLPFTMYDNFICNMYEDNDGDEEDGGADEAFNVIKLFTDRRNKTNYPPQEFLENLQTFRGYLPIISDNIIKSYINLVLESDGIFGDVDDIFNSVKQLSSNSRKTFRLNMKKNLQKECSILNNLYTCSYMKRMSKSSECSSAIISGEIWKLCCDNWNIPTLPPKVCGISFVNPALNKNRVGIRIVGGIPSVTCEYPWAVFVFLGRGVCGGSIIDKNHILLAAHCVRIIGATASDIIVLIGEHDLTKPPNVVKRVKAVHVHPHYRLLPSGHVENDVAILTLDTPLTYSTCIQPICLPRPGDGRRIIPGTECVVVGWGLTSNNPFDPLPTILQEVVLPTYSGEDCKTVYRNPQITNSSIQICAGIPGRGSCSGDSGGPLMCPVDGRYVQYGIVSFGPRECGHPDTPGIYTDVSAMLGFIYNVTSSIL